MFSVLAGSVRQSLSSNRWLLFSGFFFSVDFGVKQVGHKFERCQALLSKSIKVKFGYWGRICGRCGSDTGMIIGSLESPHSWLSIKTTLVSVACLEGLHSSSKKRAVPQSQMHARQ